VDNAYWCEPALPSAGGTPIGRGKGLKEGKNSNHKYLTHVKSINCKKRCCHYEKGGTLTTEKRGKTGDDDLAEFFFFQNCKKVSAGMSR